jgi:integrase
LEEMEAVATDFKPTNEMEARSQVLLAFLLLANGIRIESALDTTIGDLNLRQGFVYQRNPKTGRPQRTDLLKFKQELFEILTNWVDLLKNQYNFTEKDPLFPRVQMALNDEFMFEKDGYKKEFITPNE